MSRILVPSTSPYAPIVGFSRAVRVGNIISIGGTAPIDDNGDTVGLNNPAEQARRCYITIEQSLNSAGASLSDVIRTRTFLTRIDDWKEVASVRGEYFKTIMPVDTVVEISRFINSDWLIEIEVDAVISENDV